APEAGEARRFFKEGAAAPLALVRRGVERPARVERLKPHAVDQHAHLDAGVPRLARRKLDAEDDAPALPARRGRAVREAQRDAAVDARSALLALVVLVVRGTVV